MCRIAYKDGIKSVFDFSLSATPCFHNVLHRYRPLLCLLPSHCVSNRTNSDRNGCRVNYIWYVDSSMYVYYTQTVYRLFCYCCHSGHLSAYVGDSSSKICWLTAEFRHQGIPSTTSKRCLLAAALLLFSTDTIVYALDFLGNGTLNIKLGPFNADSGAISLEEQLFIPNLIFIRINVSQILVDPEHSYFNSTFVLMLLWCGGLGLYVKVHSSILSLLLVCLELLVSLSVTFHCLLIAIKVCVFLEGALQIKAGAFSGATQTDIQVPLGFEIILAVALLVTNVVATLMILHKTWYHICLSVAYKSWLRSGGIRYKWKFSRNKTSLLELNKSCLFL